MRRSFIHRILSVASVAVVALASASCGEVARTGQAPVMLVIDSVTAASGATPNEFGSFLNSDVETLVQASIGGQTVMVPTVFSDVGRVTMRTLLKNSGGISAPLAPSELNVVTIRRYRVRFIRADGRNTPGVDVPYGFDGTLTFTVGPNGGGGGFEIVRHSMKEAPPLRNLVGGGANVFIYAIAEITFYGVDQAGNEVSADATMSVNFADWGDPR